MQVKTITELFTEHNTIFRKINYLLLDGVNIAASNMPAEYSFIEEYIDILSEYYNNLGYKLENYDNNFYLSVVRKDRYTSFEYFSKSETFLGMYLSLKYFQNTDNPVFYAEEILKELFSLFPLESLYEIFVKRMQNFHESHRRVDTITESYAKTLRQLNRYNFIDIVEGTISNIHNSLMEVKGSIKRFFELALELYDKEKEEVEFEDVLNIFIKDTDFEIDVEDN